MKYNFKGIGELGDLQKDELTGEYSCSSSNAKLTNRRHWCCQGGHGVGIRHFEGYPEAGM
jgi:hypothetical protein